MTRKSARVRADIRPALGIATRIGSLNPLVDELVRKLPPDSVYPSGKVVPIRPGVRGRSFFPGGSGLFNGASQPVPYRPIMLVGQDFGTADYWRDLRPEREPAGGTWSGLRRMLDAARVDPRRCFFTNALLGVRVSKSMEGPSPGLSSEVYVDASVTFWTEQVRILRPCVVVALGVVPTLLLARELRLTTALPKPGPSAAKDPTWKEIDPFTPSVRIEGAPAFAFATSLHPSRYWCNLSARTWRPRDVFVESAHDEIWQEIKSAGAS